jgi:hypothetical protein
MLSVFNSISFRAVAFGWMALIVSHASFSRLYYGDVASGDLDVVAFWATLFLLIYNALFIQLPSKWITRISHRLSFPQFVLASTLYALVGFTILIGWAFISSDFLVVFFDAAVFGLVQGAVCYKYLTQKENVSLSFFTSLLIPALFLAIYLIVFPALLPRVAYKLVPKSIKTEIFNRTIQKISIGDDASKVFHMLPGEFDENSCHTNQAGASNKFSYVIKIECCKVTRIEYSYSNVSYTIGGRKQPCS